MRISENTADLARYAISRDRINRVNGLPISLETPKPL